LKRLPSFRPSAFTLFEVLMALGIFAMAVVGAMTALNSVLGAAREARLSAAVRTQMENRLAVLQGEELKEWERTVSGDTLGIVFKESLRREKVIGKEGKTLNGFWRATVIAQWELDGEKGEETAEFLRYRP
jgi:prepilin-type N-terminal cleavage/methylation domain-containing protein